MTHRNNSQPTRTGLSNVALFCLIGLIPVGVFVGYFLINL